MAKVIRQLEFNNEDEMKEYFKKEFDYIFLLEKGRSNYPDQELKGILVNLSLEFKNDKLKLSIVKLVTLKAFLLSKEQEMDIVDLILNIDNIMNMSVNGLIRREIGILNDDSLRGFLDSAKIQIEKISQEEILLSDSKRIVTLVYRDSFIDFNTIKLVKEV